MNDSQKEVKAPTGERKKENGFFRERVNDSQFILKLKSIKNVEVLLALIVVGIILIIYASTISAKNETVKNNTEQMTDTEQRLAGVLSEIEGAGEVSVMIYCDGANGTLYGASDREILGVIVVAEGAKDIGVRLKLVSATTTALDIKSDKVEIFAKQN